jgi:hypothetical protein
MSDQPFGDYESMVRSSDYCACIHSCSRKVKDQVFSKLCFACVGGWHSMICHEFTSEVANYRLKDVPLTSVDCGRCGFEYAEHHTG